MALELLKNSMIFLTYFFTFFQQKSTLSSCLIAEKLTFLIVCVLATLKFGKKEKFGKYIKVQILFVQRCNFTRCRLNNNISLLTTNSKCYRNIYINELNKTISLLTNFLNYFLAFLMPSKIFL